jgi:hypothetical protein
MLKLAANMLERITAINQVFAKIEKVGVLGGLGDFKGVMNEGFVISEVGDFKAVVSDDYVEDIEITFLADVNLLAKEPHEIAMVLAQKEPDFADILQAALTNGTSIFINNEPEMDHEAYRAAAGIAKQLSP